MAEGKQKTKAQLKAKGEWEAKEEEVRQFVRDHEHRDDNPRGILTFPTDDPVTGAPATVYPHQVTATNHLLGMDATYAHGKKRGEPKSLDRRNASMLAIHEVGTGKTITAILVIAGLHRMRAEARSRKEAVPATKTVIIVPKSVLYMWHETVKKWTVLDKEVLLVPKQDNVTSHQLKDAQVIVTTCNVVMKAYRTFMKFKTPGQTRLRRNDPTEEQVDYKKFRDPATRRTPLKHPLFELLPHGVSVDGKLQPSKPSPIALTIVDEAHLYSNPSTWMAAAIRQFAVHSQHTLGLTGTPVQGKADEIANLARLLEMRSNDPNDRAKLQRPTFYTNPSQQLVDQHVSEWYRTCVDRVDKEHLGLPPLHETYIAYDPFVGLGGDGTRAEGAIGRHNAVLRAAKGTAVSGSDAAALDDEAAETDDADGADALPDAPENAQWGRRQRDTFSAMIKLGHYEFHSLLGDEGAKAFGLDDTLYQKATARPSQAMLLIERVIRDRQANGHERIAVFAESATQLELLRRHLEAKPEFGELFLFQSRLDEKRRAEMVNDFLRCPKGVILLTKAGGIGINLQRGCEVLLSVGSLPWNATDIQQAVGRVHRINQRVQSARASTALTEAVHSLAHGRAVGANDPEVLEYEAEARGVNSGFVMEGNLFARSTWQRFTLSALDSRGMCTPDEEKRVLDQGICMSHRVRNHVAASGEPVRTIPFHGCTLASEVTFAGIERNKRKRADLARSAPTGLESVAAQTRKQEAELSRDVMEDALNVDNQFEV